MKRKLTAFLLLFTLFVTLQSSTSIALEDLGFTCWYSNTNEIAYWSESNLEIFTHPYNSEMDASDLENYVDTAISRWNDGTGINCNFVTTQSGSDIDVLGFTREEFTNDFGIEEDAMAIGLPTESDLVITGGYDGGVYHIYETTEAILYFCWDTISEDYSSSEWKKLFTHEMGHVLGFWGHRSSGSSVMRTHLDDCSSYPSSTDEDHMGNVY